MSEQDGKINIEKKDDEALVNGTINIDYSVTCPHCNMYFNSMIDTDWWDAAFGVNFPVEHDDLEVRHEVTCPSCEKPFTVTGFHR